MPQTALVFVFDPAGWRPHNEVHLQHRRQEQAYSGEPHTANTRWCFLTPPNPSPEYLL